MSELENDKRTTLFIGEKNKDLLVEYLFRIDCELREREREVALPFFLVTI